MEVRSSDRLLCALVCLRPLLAADVAAAIVVVVVFGLAMALASVAFGLQVARPKAPVWLDLKQVGTHTGRVERDSWDRLDS